MNNQTTAEQPLQPVAENSEVLAQQVLGTITRVDKGPFESVVKQPDNKVTPK